MPPQAWNDESYRSQWVRFNAEQAAATAFDPAWAPLACTGWGATQCLPEGVKQHARLYCQSLDRRT